MADARFAKPLDRELILDLARHHEALITIEEGSVGGFGSHVAQLLAEEGVFDRGLRFRSMVLPDSFIQQDSPEKMYAVAALNASRHRGEGAGACSGWRRWGRGGPEAGRMPEGFTAFCWMHNAMHKACSNAYATSQTSAD